MKLTFGSLFSGIGGFDAGFEQAGLHCEWQCENDKYARAVLERHFTVPIIEDVKDVNSKTVKPVDIICGGFPCQDISIAGSRKGLAGERSGLWFEFHRILSDLKPRWVVIENVPGLLSSNGGKDFAIVLHGLVECGYRVAWRILNSQHFGLAQRRKRVFIVGHSGDDGRAGEVLFEPESSAWYPHQSRETRQARPRTSGTRAASGGGVASPDDPYLDTITGTVTSHWHKGNGGPSGDECYNLIAPTLRANDHQAYRGDTSDPLVVTPDNRLADTLKTKVGFREGVGDSLIVETEATPADSGSDLPVAFHENQHSAVSTAPLTGALTSQPGGKGTWMVKESQMPDVEAFDVRNLRSNGAVSGTLQAKSSGGYSLNYQNPIFFNTTFADSGGTRQDRPNGGLYINETDTSHTLTSKTPQIETAIVTGRVRRLMPVECERLQGFEDNWTDSQSDTQRYKQLGNAVSVPVAQWIAQRIIKAEENNS